MTHERHLPEHGAGFKKVLGRLDAIALGVGAMIGFGWVVPALVGLVVGTLAAASRPRPRRGEREAIPVTAGHGRTAAD